MATRPVQDWVGGFVIDEYFDPIFCFHLESEGRLTPVEGLLCDKFMSSFYIWQIIKMCWKCVAKYVQLLLRTPLVMQLVIERYVMSVRQNVEGKKTFITQPLKNMTQH